MASAGQCEIDMRYESLLDMADDLQWFKYVVKNTARKYHKTATFMPKPVFNDNGSGMHTNTSIWKGDKNLFAGKKYAGLSQLALYFIGGLVRHARALIALTNPTTNSYKRLVPGFEAPVNMTYSAQNRSAAIRIPTYSDNPRTKRVEFRTPDPSCNAYLAFSAMVMAGLDGIRNKLDPGEPFDKDIFFTSARDLEGVVTAPMSLDLALDALEQGSKRRNIDVRDVCSQALLLMGRRTQGRSPLEGEARIGRFRIREIPQGSGRRSETHRRGRGRRLRPDKDFSQR
ncbi:hypothetical protein ES703_113540 [subsurface metagenome]